MPIRAQASEEEEEGAEVDAVTAVEAAEADRHSPERKGITYAKS